MSGIAGPDQLVLSVYDNGVGMSAEQVEDIRRQVGRTSKIDGHGLGLQFVQRECEQNKFTLQIRSEGKRTKFIISAAITKNLIIDQT